MMADDVMIGSRISFLHGGSLFNWQAVSDYRYRRFKANQVLLDEAVRRGRAAGAATINLGASPPDAEGLIDYKERWGGRRVVYDVLSGRSGIFRMVKR